ncbi:MAG: aldo/keto reductase [Thalassovita sp.]
MERIRLGRTGLNVSVAGLGCGGHSRLGQSQGKSFDHSVDLVLSAIDAGVNFIDTAASYGTEEIVGAAIKSRRDQVVISTKQGVVAPGGSALGTDMIAPELFEERVNKSLRKLEVETIDILHLHGVMAHQYAYCRDTLLPVLKRLQAAGKIRFLGLTERFIRDTDHQMLRLALQDDHWDVVMAGFNFLNPSARKHVFALTQEKDIGTLVMFAVRRALSQPDVARDLIRELIQDGTVDAAQIDQDAPLDFLTAAGVADQLTEAAYRFCRHEPGAQVVLTGTGAQAHLTQNVQSILKPPLPQAVQAKLRTLFGHVESVSGN